MNVAKWRRRFIRTLRAYPFVVLSLVAIAFSMGGFSEKTDSSALQQVIIIAAYFFIGGAPILAIIGFIIIGQAESREFKANRIDQGKFDYRDAFDIPSEEMRGFKLTFLTARPPQLTGLTGDTYKSDASAICLANSEHIPPVINCECGFYAFKNREDAKFELSINPGSFLIDVELYGIGFVYKRGYRAETQVVDHLRIPKNCMRCKILPAKVFVPTFKLGLGNYSWWQWQIRCGLCSSSFKVGDKVSIQEMSRQLAVTIS